MEKQLVVFNLADEDYGVDIATVEGIVKMQAITNVPCAPSFVEGITNLRGEVLPVIDLRKRFGLPQSAAGKETRIVNVEVDGVKVGMVVDAVSEVLRVSDEDIEPLSPIVTAGNGNAASLTGSRNGFIIGVVKVSDTQGVNGGARDSGRLVLLLDLTKVLSQDERGDLQTM